MKSLRWMLPGGAVAALAAWLVVSSAGSPERTELARLVVDRYGPVAYIAAAVLAVAFHRSRVLMAVLAIGLVEVTVRRALIEPDLAPLIGAGLAALLGLGALARDRGVTSTIGLGQVVGVPLAAAAAFALARSGSDRLAPLLTPGAPMSWVEGATGYPDVVAALILLGLAAAALVAYRRRGPVERAALWGVVMVAAGAHPEVQTVASSLLRMGAAVTLGLAVLETTYAMAYRDELTGLPARRSLMRDLEGLSGTYTLAMVDVDHFKKFNDRHGHDVGDQVLRMVASRLARAPGGGRAYRYGGEEFTLLFRGADRDEAAAHLETVRASVASAHFSLRSWGRPVRKPAGAARRASTKSARGRKDGARKLSVTVSIGMADSTGEPADGPEAVLAKADKALYRAKRAGRDRVSR